MTILSIDTDSIVLADPAALAALSSALEPGQAGVLPAAVLELLRDLLAAAAQGGAVAILPAGRTLTLEEAATLARLAPADLARFLDAGRCRFVTEDGQRRITVADLVAFLRERDEQRTLLSNLTHLSEDLDLYQREIPPARRRGRGTRSA